VDSGVIDQHLIRFSISDRYWRKNGSVMAQYISFLGFKKAYDSVRRELFYNILIDFGIPRNLVGLIKISLNETYNTVRIRKLQSDKFPIQNGLKERNALSPLIFNFFWNTALGGSKRTRMV
jgi:hypothetical protein